MTFECLMSLRNSIPEVTQMRDEKEKFVIGRYRSPNSIDVRVALHTYAHTWHSAKTRIVSFYRHYRHDSLPLDDSSRPRHKRKNPSLVSSSREPGNNAV